MTNENEAKRSDHVDEVGMSGGSPDEIQGFHPVLVAARAVENRTKDGEPIAMMVEAASAVLGEHDGLSATIESVRVVKGIWPYADPGALIADQLGLGEVTTALTRIGGNATYDLVNQAGSEIASGDLSAVLICGAETMRTRRADKAAGNRSTYLPEADDAAPDLVIGSNIDLTDEYDNEAELGIPVNFYALVESVLRHRRGESPNEHLDRIAELWASGSEVASRNTNAWLRDPVSANAIATASPSNRLVASPYTKLLTSNINVDQGAALLLCSYDLAKTHGVADADMVFLLSGAGADDHVQIRGRQHLDESPAFHATAAASLTQAGLSIDDIEHLDLYSCFPSAVQLAQATLNIGDDRPFTITGGLTFAGGPFNGYCTQALAKAAELLAGTNDSAFLYGNGGFFSKHSVLVLSGAPPTRPFTSSRPQGTVDRSPTRPVVDPDHPLTGHIEAYTVLFDREGALTHAIVSVLDDSGHRHWATIDDATECQQLLETDAVGRRVSTREPHVPPAPPSVFQLS